MRLHVLQLYFFARKRGTEVGRLAVSGKSLDRFEIWLREQEKEESTVKKYRHDIDVFRIWLKGCMRPDRKRILEYKKWLLESGRKPVTANSMLASLNMFFRFTGHPEFKVKQYRIQHSVFCPVKKELRREEFQRLVETANRKKDRRLAITLEILGGTGIRVSELPFITAEAVRNGYAVIHMKGKIRTVMMIERLRKKILCYMAENNIESGPVIRTRSGKAADRFFVWKRMKSLCVDAGVLPGKVFPHNLRHLFARELYRTEKDLVMVADILGHSSVNTTRIYTISDGNEYRKCLERMRLIA